MQNPLLIQLFSHAPLDQRILMGMLEELLGEKRTQKVLDGLFPSSPIDEGLFEGRRIDEYKGLSRGQLKTSFSFDDDKVDELYERLGVVDNSADVDGESESDESDEPESELGSTGADGSESSGASNASTGMSGVGGASTGGTTPPAGDSK